MGKPRNWRWNANTQRWENVGRGDAVKAYVDDTYLGADQFKAGTLATIEAATIGSGTQLDFILGFTGSSALLTAIGTGAIAVGTITNATGLAVGDKVFGTPKTNFAGGHVGPAGFFVPTANVLNVFLQNSKPDSAGSFPAVGWDIVAVRTA